MKLFMEMQAIQTEGSRNRGIGRYSEELSKTIINAIDDTTTLLLNSLYQNIFNDIEEDYKLYKNKLQFKQYDQLDISQKSYFQKSKYIKLNDTLVKYQLSKLTATQEIIHFHSLFEGFTGKAYICDNLSDFTQNHTVVTLYDLIPLIYASHYLQSQEVKSWYYSRLKLLYEADLLLSISQSTKEDAIDLLGIPENKIINISGAIDSNKFYKIENPQQHNYAPLLKKFNITQKFILYTGGIDFRKNIDSSIAAFAKIDKAILDQYQYVIVCKITSEQKNHLLNIASQNGLQSNKIIFTDFVLDDELNILYNLAELFIFPSIYEGFGLPVLEAMNCGTAVIGSNTSSMPEIIGREDLLFDPLDVDAISQKITYILQNKQFLNDAKTYSLGRAKLFSWDISALKTIQGYKSLLTDQKNIIKQKIALFTPLPPKKSGISDYSLELIPFLSKYFDIDIYIDDYIVDSDFLKYNYNIINYRLFDQNKDLYDNIVYQFGNSSYHAYMYDIALKYSGVVVLHDFYLSGLVNHIAHTSNIPQFFFDALEYSHGDIGTSYKKDIFSGKKTVTDAIKDLPLNKHIIDAAKAIIVHSDYSKELFSQFCDKSYNIIKINQLIKIPSQKAINTKQTKKSKLGFSIDETIISAFGHISESKQYHFILESMIQGNLFEKHNIKLIFVGEFVCPNYKQKILDFIDKNKLNKKVIITGFVDDDIYKNYLLASDIGINLRSDSRGETSRALLMNMAYALPTIVNDYATFSELPDNTLIKVNTADIQNLNSVIESLINQTDYKNEISSNAYDYIVNNHNITDIVKEYYNVLLPFYQQNTNQTIIDKIAQDIAISSLDDTLKENEYLHIAEIIKFLENI